MSANEAELTEICYPPLGTSNPKILQMRENATVDFGGPWRVEKPVFEGISTYTYLGK
jgi:hypothetical protein